MLYRKKNMKYKMDPKRINNYNKFLATLDKNSNTYFHSYINDTIKKDENNIKKDENNIKKEKEMKLDIKSEIDKLIDKINTKFKIGDFSSTSFTGNISTDSYFTDNIDPNYYRDINYINKNIYNREKIYFPLHKDHNSIIHPEIPEKMKEENPEFKEIINIEVEINNINDILNIINSYPYDENIKYNINIKVLHDIKEPLQELNNMIGMNDLKINIVDQILYFIQELHKNNLANGDFMHTVIYGPPGTGKTEIAKIMGKIYSKIGILSKGTFKKVTRSDLIAGYLGQTALKTRDVIKDSLGGVLFIDEAYSLGNIEKRDSFAKECIDTLCEALSDNKENLMVIIAGYEKELKECFFNYNQGLDSRFTWRFKTDEYSPENLYDIFLKKVNEIGWKIDENSKITSEWFKKNKEYFKFYGRDIETILAKTKIAHSRRVFCKSETEKRKINLKDLDKGFEIYLKNNDAKNIKDKLEMEKYLYNTLYS
jgi:SpoVK/Ycf46/Vps4 family AAA+-type ATPase